MHVNSEDAETDVDKVLDGLMEDDDAGVDWEDTEATSKQYCGKSDSALLLLSWSQFIEYSYAEL